MTGAEGAPLLDLLAACWEIEDCTGGWNGGDVVDLVCQHFDRLGLDSAHPANRGGGTGNVEDYTREMLDAFARGEGVHPVPECECEDEIVPGACPGFNNRDEVQACNTCQRFTDDEDAAHAIADLVGGVAEERHDPQREDGAYYWVITREGSALTADQIGASSTSSPRSDGVR